MNRRISCFDLLGALGLLLGSAGAQQENQPDGVLLIHVAAPKATHLAPDGSRARPHHRIEDALAAVRAERQRERDAALTPRRIEVRLAPASYFLDTTLVLDAALSGPSAAAPTVLRGTAPGTRLLGAREIRRHQRRELEPLDPRRAQLPSDMARDAVVVIDLRGLEIAPGPFEARGMGLPSRPAPLEPIWDGEVLRIATWPDQGFAATGRIVRAGSSDPDSKDGAEFVFDDRRIEGWAEAPNAWLHAYLFHDWADALLPLGSIDVPAHTLTLGAGHRYGAKEGGRFKVQNVLAELDRPGEYCLDFTRGELLLWPPEGSERGDELLVTTLRDALVFVDGAQHLRLQDLELTATRGVLVRVEGGHDVAIVDCAFCASGSHGLVLRGDHHAARGCNFLDCGACGITLEGGERTALTGGGHVVEDCTFRRFARLEHTYRPGVSIHGVGHTVWHNRFEDAPHSAILFGGNEHVIEANEIHHVLLETGDCGAIYGGRDWAMHGTVIRHNYIHDLPGTAGRWQNAIYLDDMASGITVEGNVLARCNLGMLCGGGRSVRVLHNVFLDCGSGITFDARGTGWMAKDIADPATSTLQIRLRAIPFDSEPWVSRYPAVGKTLTEAFGRPLGSSIEGNAFFRTPFGRVDDREMVRVESNRSDDGELVIPTDGDGRIDVGSIPGFPAIPIGTVGPRR